MVVCSKEMLCRLSSNIMTMPSEHWNNLSPLCDDVSIFYRWITNNKQWKGNQFTLHGSLPFNIITNSFCCNTVYRVLYGCTRREWGLVLQFSSAKVFCLIYCWVNLELHGLCEVEYHDDCELLIVKGLKRCINDLLEGTKKTFAWMYWRNARTIFRLQSDKWNLEGSEFVFSTLMLSYFKMIINVQLYIFRTAIL
jgi:hypothetical protein